MSDVESKLNSIFQKLFKINFEKGLNRSSIQKWDSLNHVKLIFAVEKEFLLKFSAQEAVSIKSTTDLLNAVKAKWQS